MNDILYETLVVIDRMEVGPVKLEKKRLVMPYKVVKGDEVALNELIYSYEEAVFDHKQASAHNLAAMIGVQFALNYGLFCKQIIFYGSFDEQDKLFINSMMDNTSREIYVKKFLEHNPFLLGQAAKLPVVVKERYTNAEILFSGAEISEPWQAWEIDKQKHCILSSGGKDSLLSYGLLKETGYDAQSIFVNESGRHWFTAINAYRDLKEKDPNTARVWSNCDRMFAWMLRHLSFVRQDFANVRSDEYPIRLWTVAVFLFGVLPLMKKRGLGRLLIGDEYDTTRLSDYQGIEHYDGLFDQSRYFDEALSRFFMQKGWGISQFSVLRPVAELLIQKTLALRYPLLLQNQVSCHAAHKKGERIHPCGKCEKCRRITSMLSIMNVNPEMCGYTPEQVKHGLSTIISKGVHQIGEDAQQLTFLLAKSGLVTLTEEQEKNLSPQPQVMNLRFDDERSTFDCIPQDLRKKLFPIFLQYSEGAVVWRNNQWMPVDILSDDVLNLPYAFELDSVEQNNVNKDDFSVPQKKMYVWGELTWEEAEKRLEYVDIALLPVGAIEQHGRHLPLDVDSFDAEYLAHKIAEACSDPKPFVLPLIPVGVSYHHDDFKGTISVTNDALAKFIYDIGMSLARNGIKKLVIINGHGDNAPTLNYAAQMINRDARIFVCIDTGDTSDIDIDGLITTHNDVHAGEIETSTTLAIRPHLVYMDKAVNETPSFTNKYLNFSSNRGIPWYAYTTRFSESGVMGDATKATKEKGVKMWEIMIAHLVNFVETLKDMTLDEIFQQRY